MMTEKSETTEKVKKTEAVNSEEVKVEVEKTEDVKPGAVRESAASEAKATTGDGAVVKKASRSGTDPALAKLRAAAKGLLFMSESDKPIKAFVWKDVKAAGDTIDAAVLTAAKKVPDGATVTTRTVDDFFKNATANQAWFGEEEKAQAERFRALVAVLKEQLGGVQAFRVEQEGEASVA
ncbi:MAG: hypothetical protein H7145_07795, partial [Akkermansiaceae bacterium]|nr:hypothetical protein [Armatimonadota bacterium]